MADLKRPPAKLETAIELAQNIFGFTDILEVKEFKSFIDRNFYIRGINAMIPNIGGCEPTAGEFVLKIYNSKDSEEVSLIDAENQIIKLMRDKGFPCPEILFARNGKLNAQIELPSAASSKEKEVCIARMLTIVPGVEFDEIQPNKHLYYKLGQFIGKVSQTLKDFSHPVLKERKCIWDIKSFPMVPNMLQETDDEEVKRIVTEVWRSYKCHVIPHLDRFRMGTVNGDMNGENILVSKSNRDKSGYEITGFIDFGDIAESLVLIEVVVPMVFFMDRGFEASGYILAGYQSTFSLPQFEYDSLYYVAAARLCQLVVVTMFKVRDKLNKNDEYMNQTVDKYFHILKKFWACPKHEMEQIWRSCQDLL